MDKSIIANLFWVCDYEVKEGKKIFIIKDHAGNKIKNVEFETWGKLNNIVEAHNNALAETIKAYNNR